jgi:hypothetical protein
MARGNSPGSARARSSISERRSVGDRAVEAPQAATGAIRDPIHSAVDTLFNTDERIRDALTTRLAERSAPSLELTERARDVFDGFSPSRFSGEERKRLEYLAPGDDLTEIQKKVFTEGAAETRHSDVSRSIAFRPGKELKALMSKNGADGGAAGGTVELEDIVSYLTTRPSPVPSLTATPEFNSCKAEAEAKRRLQEIKSPGKHDGAGEDDEEETKKKDAADTKTAEFVRESVTLQMETATSPEEKLSYAVPGHADQDQLQKSIQSFELRSGPSDVTSYHDFNTLQIAFQSVWTEIFDGQLTALGQELYKECVKLKEFVGVDHEHAPIDTLDDLKNLMDEVRDLSRVAQDEIPWQPRDGAPADGVSVSSNSAVDFTKAVIDPASLVTDAIGDKTVAAIIDPAGAAIDVVSALLRDKQQLTWGSFPGPFDVLPEPHNRITPSFEEGAVADGEVEIVLKDARGASSPWKGVGLFEFDAAGTLLNTWKISNWPQDNDVWDKGSYNRLPLYTPQIEYGLLEFDTESYFGIHKGFFLLGGLNERIKNRTRVTFTW